MPRLPRHGRRADTRRCGVILAIDPGKTGAVALLYQCGVLVDIADMGEMYAGPVLSPALLKATILDLCCNLPDSVTVCVVEAVNSHGMGRQSAFNFGQSLGTCRAIPLALGIRVVDITPSVWKGAMRLGKDKNVARARAAERWPAHVGRFERIKDDGRAEAALLGAFYLDYRAS